jgi:F-type H+-transporting ATPase subunit alpha
MSNELQKEIGLVRATKHYLASIEGLPSAHVHDILINEEGGRALVTALSHDAVEAMVLDQIDVRPGQRFELFERTNQISVGPHLFGRVVNALCDPVDGKGGFPPKNAPLMLERSAGDLAARELITEQLITGFSVVDTVLPIGKGQRQLLMGPIQSGTDAFCREVIRNQEGLDIVCIYAAVGKRATQVRRLADTLFSSPAAGYTIIVASFSDDLAPQIAITPAVALYIAEHFCAQGKEVLLVFDDLYTHAKYLREIALLEGRLPGRDSYPGDIFYQQAHLIERAGNFKGKGSITLLPVLQTDPESYTDLIMTNIMGTTDGHLAFSAQMYAQGVFPPVVQDESVTRVGKHTQSVVQKQLSTAITSLMADAKEQERFMQFGSQVSDATRAMIEMGAIIKMLLNQDEHERLDIETQTILLSLVFTTFSSGKDAAFFREHAPRIRAAIAEESALADLRSRVRSEKSLDTFLRQVEKQTPFFTQICQK